MTTEAEVRDAEMRVVDARTDTKIARLEGKLDTLGASIVGEIRTLSAETRGEMRSLQNQITSDHEYDAATRWILIGLLITSVIALGGLMVTLATYGDALFSRGMNVRDVIQNTIKDYEAQRKANPTP